MKKIIVLTLAVFALIFTTATAQDGQILKKNFTISKGIPTLRLIGTTPIFNFGTVGGKIDFYNSGVSDLTLTHSANTLTLAGGNFAMGANNLTLTGSIAATGARVTKGWFTDLEVTNAVTVNGTAISATYVPYTGATGTLALGTRDITTTGSIGTTGARVTKVWAADAEFTSPPTISGATMAKMITVKKTIGGVGVAACDFNFVTAADQVEQVIDLGSIIPAKARVLDIFTFTDAAFTGAVSLSTEAGNTSSGHEFLGAADIIAANAINAMATDHDMTVVPNVAATKIYVSATPGANWSLVTAGKMTVCVTYIGY